MIMNVQQYFQTFTPEHIRATTEAAAGLSLDSCSGGIDHLIKVFDVLRLHEPFNRAYLAGIIAGLLAARSRAEIEALEGLAALAEPSVKDVSHD